MKISALFLTLAAAQDGDAMASQGAASQGAASQGAQGAQTGGYGAQQGEQAESYGEEAAPQQTYAAAPAETYAAAPVETYAAAPVAHAAPKVCFQGCPAESPCYGNGGCQPSSCGGHTHYAEEQHESYAESPVASSAGYRRLADYGEQGEAQQSYGEAAPVAYAAPQEACGCPPGTVDTAHLALSSPLILWIAFALLFIPAMFFVCRGNDGMQSVLGATTVPTYQQYKDFHQLSLLPSLTSTNNADFQISLAAGAAAEAIFDTILLPRIFAGMICTIAALAYLTMATGHGYIVKCNGRAFYYARYVDWAITTPLLLFDIAQIAGFGSTISQSFLVAMDILMIAAGLIGELVDGSVRWAFFGFGMLFFVPLLMVCAAVPTRPISLLFNCLSASSSSLGSPGCSTPLYGSSPTLAAPKPTRVLPTRALPTKPTKNHTVHRKVPRVVTVVSREPVDSLLLVSFPSPPKLSSTLSLTSSPRPSSVRSSCATTGVKISPGFATGTKNAVDKSAATRSTDILTLDALAGKTVRKSWLALLLHPVPPILCCKRFLRVCVM